MENRQNFITQIKTTLAPFKAFIKRPANGHIYFLQLGLQEVYMHGLLNYGFQKEAIELARKISGLVLMDIKISGGMHENYDAETGKPLAAPNFVSWNILVGNMLEEAVNKKNPFEI